jgi:hypothetical protein
MALCRSIGNYLFLVMGALAAHAQPIDKTATHYQTFLHVFDPASLTDRIDPGKLGNFKSYYVERKSKKQHQVEHILEGKRRTEWLYVANKKVKEITQRSFDDDGNMKPCHITIENNMRHIRCFNVNEQLISEEWYNEKTTEYTLTTFDDAGNVLLNEWGRYSPPANN